MKKLKITLVMVILTVSLLPWLATSTSKTVCVIYFSGIGCPHCAKTDPVIFKKLVNSYNLTVIEYEVYQTPGNGEVMYTYDSTYGTGLGIPLIIFDEKLRLLGDLPILENFEKMLKNLTNNSCLLLNGRAFVEDLDFNSLPGAPKIWAKERILIKGLAKLDNNILKRLLYQEDPSSLIRNLSYTHEIDQTCVPYSGGKVCFKNGVKIKDWIFLWSIANQTTQEEISATTSNQTQNKLPSTKFTIAKIVSLAAVDAVNPCALAVLTIMLIAIMTYNPKDKKKVLLAGLAFSLSVYVMYLAYGVLLVKFFQAISQLVWVKLYFYQALAIGAVILGALNLKDFIRYKPGGVLTEMPLSWRPKVKSILSKVTSPGGAAFVGVLVTVFLLPCTMGPYVIAAGLLSPLELIKVIPWLMLYDFIFITPMLGITFIVYVGFSSVQKVSGWKDKNIKYLHGIAGAIMLTLGLLMLFGII